MKVAYKTKDGRFACEFEGKGHSEIHEQIASFQEVFEECVCGKCGSTDTRFVVRIAKDGKKEYTYHEMRCNKCGAKLSLSVKDDGMGSLFPVRFERDGGEYKKTEDGKLIPRGKNGWVKYNKETSKEE